MFGRDLDFDKCLLKIWVKLEVQYSEVCEQKTYINIFR